MRETKDAKVKELILRIELEGKGGVAGEEGGWFSLHPIVVAGIVERGEEVAALAGGHLEEALLFAARLDDEPLGGAEGRLLGARGGAVPRHLVGGHIEPAGDCGQGAGDGVLDIQFIEFAVRKFVGFEASALEAGEGIFGGGADLGVP